MRHFLSVDDLDADELRRVVALALQLKRRPRAYGDVLAGRTLLFVSSKPSLRTRLSFEVAMRQLGGGSLAYGLDESTVGKKETFGDLGATASRYVDVIAARLGEHADLEDVAAASRVPVINALTDHEHPCQAVSDMATLAERRVLRGARLAFVGDARNNVTHSLLLAGAKLGVDIAVACPAAMAPDPIVLSRALTLAATSGASVVVTRDARAAVRGADAVYTDTWMSYHVDAARRGARATALAPYRVDERLMALSNDAVFMHCLPATRGEEVTAEVIDGPRSIVFDQVENRLHGAKAILLTLLRPTLVDALPEDLTAPSR